MRIEHTPPPQNLEKMIDYIWMTQDYSLAVENRDDVIMPLGHLNIIFNFEKPYYLENETGAYEPMPDVALVGQIQMAKSVRYEDQVYQIGISLLPVGFMLLMNRNCDELTEKIVEGNQELWSLYETLIQIDSIEERVHQIYFFLEEKFEQYLENDQLEVEMLEYIHRSIDQFSVREMANYFYMSLSTLERQFKKKVGLTPKAYADIIRFSAHVNDSESLKMKYYDQSHLIRTSKKLTGKTTKQLKESQNELTLNYILNLKNQEPK